MCNARKNWIASLILLIAASPAISFAQASRSGPTFALGGGTSPVMLPDVAHDPVNDRYLVVFGNGYIEGHVLNSAGGRISAFVVAEGVRVGGYAQTPRVAWGAGINGGNGGYLVTWHESVGQIAQVRGKILAADGTLLTPDIVIATEAAAPGTGSNWTMGAAVAYSTASQEFLVTWMGGYLTTQDIRFNRVSIGGQVLQPTAAITAGVDWERDPSVAYNPAQNEFYIAYAGYLDAGGFGYVNGQRIQAGTGAALGGPAMFIQTAATLIPSVEYNPATGQYLVSWYNRTSGSAAFYGISVNAATGAAVGAVRLMSSYYHAYDALDVAYSAATGGFLLVTHGAGSQNWEDAAVPIRADGTPIDNGFILTQTTDVRPLRSNPSSSEGNFNPRVAAGRGGRYLAATASNFAAIHGQFASSSASDPGPGPGPGPTPTQPDTRMSLDIPVTGSSAMGRVTVAGWAIDLNSSAGSGVDAVHVHAFRVGGGTPIFLGAASVMPRADVGSAYGSRFTNGGFTLSAPLPPGTYDVAAYAHSTVTGTFTAVRAARVTVLAAAGNPFMWVDTPTHEQAVGKWPTTFDLAGWAIDRSSGSGSGIDGVHLWAYPVAGGSPFWLGECALGIPRPDVAAAFGPQFLNSGFHRAVGIPSSVPSGAYDIVVWAHSSVAGSFTNWHVVRVVVP
jgi:hypothetical protein